MEGAGGFTRSEAFNLLVRSCVAAALTYFGVRWAINMMDPTKKRLNNDKKRAEVVLRQLGLSPDSVKLTDYETSIACQLVEPTDIPVSWDNIAGLDSVICELQETVILPITARRMLPDGDLALPPKGVLLHGPPGCGKTLLAKACAREAGTRFINLEISCLTDKWYGESQKLCSAVFSLAVKLEPCIIFIDEIDSFLRARASHDHEATAMMKALFMQLWDGLVSRHHCCVIVMGATNRPRDVDAAILRRMPASFHVGLPVLQQRKSIVSLIMRDQDVDRLLDYNRIAQQTEGLSGSDLREVCRYASLFRMRDAVNESSRSVSGNDFRPDLLRSISQDDFDRAIIKMKESKSHIGFLSSVDSNLD